MEAKDVEGGQRPAKASSRLGMRIYPATLILKIAKEGKELYKYQGNRRETTRLLIEKYPTANLKRRTVDRWVFDLSEEKFKEIEITAKRKREKVRLPSNIKAMEASRTVILDLQSEIYVKYRFREDNLKLPISFCMV